MHLSAVLILISLFSVMTASRSAPVVTQIQKALEFSPSIRNATIDDLDDITDLIIAAFSASNVYDYVFQFRKQYPRYHWECRREQIEEAFFQNPDNSIIHVIDAPCEDSTKGTRVASIAVWELLRKGHKSIPFSVFSTTTTNCFEHIDLNFTRALSYSYQFGSAKQRYIDDAFDHQFYLDTLATHPDYDGHGFGAAQCHWGMSFAKQKHEIVTLISTPAGYPLYVSLGFESLVNISITKVDGEPLSWFEDMVLKP